MSNHTELQRHWDQRDSLIKVKNRLSPYPLDELLKTDDLYTGLQDFNSILLECSMAGHSNFPIPPLFFYMISFFAGFSDLLKPFVTYKPDPDTLGKYVGLQLMHVDIHTPTKFKYTKEYETLLTPEYKRHLEPIRAYLGAEKGRKKEQFETMVLYLDELRYVMQTLADDPILVDTGQYREVRDKPRPFADVQNEIATKLTNCPNFQARVKTVGGEAVIKTLPAASGVTGQELAARRMSVLQQTRYTYCLPRAEVEQEIELRQEALMQEPEIEPKSRREPAEDTQQWRPSRRHKEPPQE